MRVTVTGGAGFIGTALVDNLLAYNHEVVILDNLSASVEPEKREGMKFIKGDVHTMNDVWLATKDAEVVYHLACCGISESQRDPSRCYSTNVLGTMNVLDCARERKQRVVYASSCSVYGNRSEMIEEDAPLDAWTPYAAAKIAGEAYCAAYHRLGWVKSVVLRPSNVYGPGQHPDRHEGVVAKFIRHKIKGERAVVYGDCFVRDFTYIEDVAVGFRRALDHEEHGPYNVASGSGLSVDSLARMIGVEYEYSKPRETDFVTTRVLSNQRISAALGWRPWTKMPYGLFKTEEWLKKVLR